MPKSIPDYLPQCIRPLFPQLPPPFLPNGKLYRISLFCLSYFLRPVDPVGAICRWSLINKHCNNLVLRSTWDVSHHLPHPPPPSPEIPDPSAPSSPAARFLNAPPPSPMHFACMHWPDAKYMLNCSSCTWQCPKGSPESINARRQSSSLATNILKNLFLDLNPKVFFSGLP